MLGTIFSYIEHYLMDFVSHKKNCAAFTLGIRLSRENFGPRLFLSLGLVRGGGE